MADQRYLLSLSSLEIYIVSFSTVRLLLIVIYCLEVMLPFLESD